ncbi:MAG: hypothetical protein KDC53_18065 [Saprospiraceae bacterium]|nr:hypothetical protein [Saprospiraceae bacterium]
MKTLSKYILWLFFFSVPLILFSQGSRWYLQMNGGYLLLNQLEQLGFEPEHPAGLISIEVGKTYQPLSVGVQQTLFQEYGFYRYRIKQSLQTIYAKYSLNQFINALPYGVDPYFMLGVSYTQNRFQTYEQPDQGPLLVSQETVQNPGYTIGGGIQIGSRNLTLGLHYQYTSGRETFSLADFETLPFATGSHLISLNIGYRFTAFSHKRTSRCPRFGGKGMLRF